MPSVRRLLFVVGALLAAAPAVAAAADPSLHGTLDSRNRIVAVVNSDVITAEDVAQAMAPLSQQFQDTTSAKDRPSKVEEAQRRVVEMLINERLMLQEAKTPRTFEVAKGQWATPPAVMVSDEELADALADVKGQFASEEKFLGTLKDHGMTLDDLKRRYRDQITIQKLVDREVRSRLVVSPSEIAAYYQQHLDRYHGAEAVRLSNLLIRVGGGMDDAQAQAQAQEIWKALKGGADFVELAKRHSQGPNAAEGGMMGWVERGRLIPEIEQAVFALEPGQMSPVVKSALGYHVFRLEEHRPVQAKPIADVQGEIRNALLQEKFQQRYREWIAKLRDRAYITIKTPAASSDTAS